MSDDVGEQSLFGESEAPPPNPQVVGAAVHQATNPFWAQRGGGRGRGRGNKRPRPADGDGTNPSMQPAVDPSSTQLVIEPNDEPLRFAPISLRELELQRRRNTDGVESSVASDDEEVYRVARAARKKVSVPTDPAEKLAAAAFGGGGGSSANGKKRAGAGGDDLEEEDDEEEQKDDDASSAVESSVFAECVDYPLKGENCVGCIFDRAAVGIIDKFVRENVSKMTESSLFKAAASTWVNSVVAPRARENVRVPRWDWKSIQSHYELHVADPLLQRVGAIRTLGTMRAFQESSLLKVMPDGSKVLDNKSAELLLKTVALLDKQISSLGQLEASSKMPPPPPRGR